MDGPAPEGSEVVETAEYGLVRLPDRFPDSLQVQWVRSGRPAVEDVVARAVGFGLPEASVFVKLSAPDGFDEALLGRGAQLVDTSTSSPILQRLGFVSYGQERSYRLPLG